MDVGRLLERYARVLSLGGGLLAAAALTVDLRWLTQPIATVILTGAVVVLRASPVRLSKYSYLTQSGVAVLVGAVTVGASPVVAALYLGVLLSDIGWLRSRPGPGSSTPAGR